MPTSAINIVPAYTIRELTGSRRTLQLLGRALPQGPYELEGGFRVNTTWLPGYTDGTQTKLGAIEDPTTIHGVWKDKYIGELVEAFGGNTLFQATRVAPAQLDGSAIESVDALCRLVDDIRRQGQDVEATWGSTARVGTIEKFKQSWRTVHDVEWSITFAWRSQGDRPPEPVFGLENSVSDTATTLQQRMAAMLGHVQTNLALVRSYQDRVRAQVSILAGTVLAYQDLVGSLDVRALDPVDGTRRALGLCTGLIEQSAALILLTSSDPPRAILFSAAESVNPLFPPMGEVVRATTYQRTLHDDALAIRNVSALQRSVLQTQLRSNILAEYRVRAGDDLRTISQQFYNSPDGWRRILAFNNLGDSQLAPGQILLIPRADQGLSA